MTTREVLSLGSEAPDPGAAFHTGLIARLANELYADGAPSAVQAPGFNSGPAAPDLPAVSAAGPALGSGAPSVHPTIEPLAERPAGPALGLPASFGDVSPPRSFAELYPSFAKDHPRANAALSAFDLTAPFIRDAFFTSPPLNSGVPELSELGGRSRKHPTSPGEVDRRSRAGEGALRPESPAPPHPALRADLSPLGRGEGLRSSSAGFTPSVESNSDTRATLDASRLRVVDAPYGGLGDEPFAADYYFLKPQTARGVTPAYARAGSHPESSSAPRPLDVSAVRRDFPALHQNVNGHPLVWLDNAATTHKPQSVIDATSQFYSRDNSNIHRAAHTLAARATDLFEGARDKVRDFLGAASSKEIVFLRGTTEAINLVANSFGADFGPGDEIVVSQIEHHANIVPWQLLAERSGATLRVIPVDDRGDIILEQFATLLSGRTKIVSITHVANALGTVNPVAQVIALAHSYGVPVLVDAAQSAPHLSLNVQALDADFLVFSGHKVFGPTGIGALYGKAHLLEKLPPWQGGGHMIEDVTFARTIYKGIPEKFEAGTPDIAGAVGLGAAIDYLHGVGLPAIAAYEHALLEYAEHALTSVRGVRLIGTAREKASVMSFTLEGHDNADVAKHLDAHGVAVRAGHHCALPALRRFGVDQSVRASLAFYNTSEDVDVFIRALHGLARR